MARTLEVFLPVSIGKKYGKQGETFYLLWGSFLRCRDGGFYSFALRTSAVATIKSRPFDKTSSHEFPATCEDVNIEGVTSGALGKKHPLQNRRKVPGIFGPARKTFENFSLCEKLRAAVGRVGLSPFPRDDSNIWRPDFYAKEVFVLRLTFLLGLMEMQNWNKVLLIVKYEWQLQRYEKFRVKMA